jgi:hypothetical protein
MKPRQADCDSLTGARTIREFTTTARRATRIHALTRLARLGRLRSIVHPSLTKSLSLR